MNAEQTWSTGDPVRLEVRDLHLSFGTNRVLRGVDLEIPSGQSVCVIGPSGSGKSTLLRTVNRLIEPDRGSVLLDGEDTLSWNPDQLRRQVGMVFQQFNLFPHKTVLQNITLALRKLKKMSAAEADEVAMRQLEIVGLRDKAGRRPSTLSGGQQQRVAIARALAMAPRAMLFDEVTSALDPELVKGILALLADLATQGMTMMVVTHEMGFARRVADQVAFMDGGVVVEAGPPDRIFDEPAAPRLRQFLSQVL
jgi:polar amino acid transport system ATP-binding protein